VATLIVKAGPLAGHRFELERELVIGRGTDGVDVQMDDPEISRQHLRIAPRDTGVELEDLGSRNGTWVEGARLAAAITLTRSAAIRIGDTELAVQIEEAAGSGDTAVSDRSDPEATVMRRAPDATTVAPVVAPTAAPPTAAPPAAAPPAAAGPPVPVPAQPFGGLAQGDERRRGAASRLRLPAGITVATIIATAAALVIYFAGR